MKILSKEEIYKLIPSCMVLSGKERKTIEQLIDTAFINGQRHELRRNTNRLAREAKKC